MTAEEVANIPREVFVKPGVEDICTQKNCGNVIEEHPDETHYIGKLPVCSDCHYKALGAYIDNNPINTPRDFE